jgi:hypothetical protein
MTYIGTVSEGKVILPADACLPEGTSVQVSPLVQPAELQQLTAALLRLAHKSRDLPADLAQNHDHYLHGQPKP